MLGCLFVCLFFLQVNSDKMAVMFHDCFVSVDALFMYVFTLKPDFFKK